MGLTGYGRVLNFGYVRRCFAGARLLLVISILAVNAWSVPTVAQPRASSSVKRLIQLSDSAFRSGNLEHALLFLLEPEIDAAVADLAEKDPLRRAVRERLEALAPLRPWRSLGGMPDSWRPISSREMPSFNRWSIAFSNDGELVVVARGDGLQVLAEWDSRFGAPQTVLRRGVLSTVSALAIAPSKEFLVIGTRVGELWSANLASDDAGSVRLRPQRTEPTLLPLDDLRFSPDGAYLASADAAGVRLWETRARRDLYRFTPPSAVLAMSFNATGDRLLVLDASFNLHTLDTRSGRVLDMTQLQIDDGAYRPAFNREGTLIAAYRLAESAQELSFSIAELWDVASQEKLQTVTGVGLAFQFGRDGRFIVNTREELWLVDPKAPQDVLQLDMSWMLELPGLLSVRSAVTSPDGTWLAIGVDEGGIFFLEIDEVSPSAMRSADPFLRAKYLTKRCFSPEERAQYQLPPTPPRWCLTGPGLEAAESARWRPKPPYGAENWREWLEVKDRGELSAPPVE